MGKINTTNGFYSVTESSEQILKEINELKGIFISLTLENLVFEKIKKSYKKSYKTIFLNINNIISIED